MDLARWTAPYVDSLKAHGWIRTDAIESAFRRVPRHSLIERYYQGSIGLPAEIELDASNPEHLRMVYSDRAFIMHMPDRSVSSAPSVMALVLESLDLRPGLRVLEIGTGSGYNAAILSEVVGESGSVTTIDITEDVVSGARRRLANAGYASIHVEAADGFVGCAARGPYDRIVATTSCGVLSPHLVEQLAPGGALLVPLLHGGVETSPLVRVTRAEDGSLLGRVVAYSQFMSPRGSLSLELWPFDRNGLRIQRQLRATAPVSERPLWAGMRNLANPTPRPGAKWSERMELLYLLAIRTRQTFIIPEGLGVGDFEPPPQGSASSMGFVLLGDDSIRVYGETGVAHHDALERVYEEWMNLGRPRMLDYVSTFLPADAAADVSSSARTDTENGDSIEIGRIDRGRYVQVLRLPR